MRNFTYQKYYLQDFEITMNQKRTQINIKITNNSQNFQDFLEKSCYWYIGVTKNKYVVENHRFLTQFFLPKLNNYGGIKKIRAAKLKIYSQKLTPIIFGNYFFNNLDPQKDYSVFIYVDPNNDQNFEIRSYNYPLDWIILKDFFLEKTE